MEKRNNIEIENVIVKNMYDCVTEINPLTYTELRDEDGERYFSFEIMLNDYDFDTDTLEIKLDDFFEVHDEIVTIYMDKLQFKDYEVVNENGLKELNVLFRVLN